MTLGTGPERLVGGCAPKGGAAGTRAAHVTPASTHAHVGQIRDLQLHLGDQCRGHDDVLRISGYLRESGTAELGVPDRSHAVLGPLSLFFSPFYYFNFRRWYFNVSLFPFLPSFRPLPGPMRTRAPDLRGPA